jgi:hypothetical protein
MDNGIFVNGDVYHDIWGNVMRNSWKTSILSRN